MKEIKIYLTWARPGEGKSVDTARTILRLFREYRATERRYPDLPRREVWVNLKLSKYIEDAELKRDPATGEVVNENGHLCYWDNPKQLRTLRDVDIIIDEVQNYIPADGWANLPRWLRKLFAQHRHRGMRIFANTQDYKAVDVNFRRMIGRAFMVSKLFSSRDISATLPPVRYIYGIIIKREFAPAQVEQLGVNDPSLNPVPSSWWHSFPQWFWLGRILVDTYDTQQDIPEYMPNSLEHIKRTCPDCGFEKVEHRTA